MLQDGSKMRCSDRVQFSLCFLRIGVLVCVCMCGFHSASELLYYSFVISFGFAILFFKKSEKSFWKLNKNLAKNKPKANPTRAFLVLFA